MEVLVSHKFLKRSVTFHVETYIVFVGHSDAAMHLNTFSNGKARRLGNLGLGNRTHQFGAFCAAIEQLLRLDDNCACDLDFGVQVRCPVLQSLEFADNLVELLALLQVIYSQIHCPARDTHTFGRCADPACRQHRIQDFSSTIDFTDNSVAIKLDSIEFDMRCH